MKPTLGQIVLYRITDQDALIVNCAVKRGDVFPMIITRVHGDTPTSRFGGQVMLDGNDRYWVMSTKFGDDPGECFPLPS